MSDKYILAEDGKTPIPCDDLIAWGKWLEKNHNKKHVAVDVVGDVRVSTVFLGLDHAWTGTTPILWETMIFGGPHDEYQERYSSHDDAVAGHTKALELVKSGAVA